MLRIEDVSSSSRAATLWPVLLLSAGLALTLLVAGARSASLERERELLFDSDAARLQEAIVTTAELDIVEFQSAVNFIATTHPGSIDDYVEFFDREQPDLPAGDPGVMFFELVPVDATEALAERERALGNSEFDLNAFPATRSTRLISTRSARDLPLFGLTLRGLDVTRLQDSVLPDGFGEADFELHVVESDLLRAFGGDIAENESRLTALLIAGVVNGDGEFLGYALRVEPIGDYLTALDTDNLNVELWVEGVVEAPVGQLLTGSGQAASSAQLSDSRRVTTAGLDWRIDVWADEAFGPGTGLLDQRSVLLSGAAISTLLALAVRRRLRTRSRLDSARFELAHAKTLAATDELTGLLNRRGLVDAARRIAPGEPAALFYIDLDGFKAVNDDVGHGRGDEVLREVATQLSSTFRAGDLICRLGGDEFVVFAPTAVAPAYIERISCRIIHRISEIDDRITASIGIAIRHEGDPVDIKELLRLADETMYRAKRAGGGRHAVVAK